MIRYKRIYPLRQNGHLASIVSVIGDGNSCEVTVKFKIRPEPCDLVIIFFNPKNYDYEIHPLKEKMIIFRSLNSFSGCVIACKKGMFLEFLMEGAVSRTRISTSKLKSAIAMDMYTTDGSCDTKTASCQSDQSPEPCGCNAPVPSCMDGQDEDREAHQKLVDYLDALECKGKNPAESWEQPAPPKQMSNMNPLTGTCSLNGVSLNQELSDAKLQYCEFINPFKDRWNGVWWKVQYPDKNWHYIVGRVLVDGQNVSVLGIPGDRHNKPVCLESCDMFAIDDNGAGYWLMFQH